MTTTTETRITIDDAAGQGSLAFTREDDGGLTIEHEILEVDGRRDHLRIRTSIAPVDAQRVYQLLGVSAVRSSTGG